jgi:hypothetical protein
VPALAPALVSPELTDQLSDVSGLDGAAVNRLGELTGTESACFYRRGHAFAKDDSQNSRFRLPHRGI